MSIKGFFAWIGKDENNCSFRNCRTRQDAEQWIEQSKKIPHFVKGDKSGIVEKEMFECANRGCTNIHRNGRFCLKCEDIWHDAQMDMAEERRQREEDLW